MTTGSLRATWRRVNPGYGRTVQRDALAQEALEAANEPRKLTDFLRFQLNRWTNQATTWLPLDWWHGCAEPTVSPATLTSYDVFAALDMAQSIDYAALTVTVRIPLPRTPAAFASVTDAAGETSERPLDYRVAVFPFYWLPEDRLREREKTDGLPLSLYQQHGLLFVSPGATISADQVYRDIIGTIAPQFPRLRVVGYDPAFAFDIAQRLGAQFDMIAIPQTFAFMTQPCYLLEGLLKSRRLSHQGHPILGWNMANIAVKRDEAGRLRPVKPAVSGSHRKRIDGAVALLMALGVMSRTVPTPEPEYKILFLGGAERSIGPSGW